jgi:hypothetical protein
MNGPDLQGAATRRHAVTSGPEQNKPLSILVTAGQLGHSRQFQAALLEFGRDFHTLLFKMLLEVGR